MPMMVSMHAELLMGRSNSRLPERAACAATSSAECHAAATTERSAVVWRPTNSQCPLLEEGGNLPLDSVRMIKDFAFTDSQAG